MVVYLASRADDVWHMIVSCGDYPHTENVMRAASTVEDIGIDHSFVGSDDGNDYESRKKPLLKRDGAVCTMK